MKITGVQTFLMQAGVPEGGPGPARHNWQSVGRNWLFVKVHTDAGITGVGECSGWPRVIERAVEDLAHVLVGEDPRHIERLWQAMFGAAMVHGMTGVVGAGAMTGLDMALWDIKGKALGVPVWDLLGGKVRDRVRIYGHAHGPEAALSLMSRGLSAVKVGGTKDLVARVAAVRAAVGPGVDIAVDVGSLPWLTAADAVVLGRSLEPYHLLFLEEPVPPEQIEQYARVRDAVAIPLAAGERSSTVWGMRPLIERELVDVIQPDTGRAGGITQLKKMAAMAESHGIMVATHSGSLGPVAEFAALHVLAAIPNALMLERMVDDWPGRAEVITAGPVSEGGWLRVPDAPGLGVDIVEEAVARHPSRRNIGLPGGAYEPGTEGERVYTQTRLGRARQFGAF